jgi:ABC-2 type transport system permease protein
MKTTRDTALLFQRYTVQMLRNPTWLFVGFSTPLLYLALFTPLLKQFSGFRSTGLVLDVFLPGILALLAFATGMAGGFGTIFELQQGVIERLRVTPASRFAILMGPLISGMLMMFVFDAVVVVAAVGFGFHLDWAGTGLLVVLLGLLMVTMSSFSVAMALITKEISSFAAIINGLNLPILLLAGVLLPISSSSPTWMRVLAHLNPLYYAVEAARALAVGAYGSSAVWHAFAVLVPLCAVVVTWATRVFRQAVS